MKTKFIINQEIFTHKSIDEDYEYYENHYKKYGFILDKLNEMVYVLFDEEFNFNEGDRVEIFGRHRIIDWKCTDISNKIIEYALIQE